jgi:hypothetical protein
VSIEIGVHPDAIAAPALAQLAAGYPRFGDELVPGMHVQLGDGRWAVVVDEPTTGPLGHMSVPVVSWSDMVREHSDDFEFERLTVGYGRRVRSRSPQEQRQYVEAVWETVAGKEEGQ